MASGAADGQVYDIHPPEPIQSLAAVSSMAAILINAQSGADAGVWVQYQPFGRCAIEVSGSATSAISVQLVGSTSAESPAVSSESGANLGSAITAKGITFADFSGIRWIKATQSAPTGGNLTVRISAIAP